MEMNVADPRQQGLELFDDRLDDIAQHENAPTDPDVPDQAQLESPSTAAPAVPNWPAKMHAMALVFLDDPLARKLAVAWVSCRGDDKLWLEAAGIEAGLFSDAHRLCSALRINGICREGGITDPLALQYITRLMMKPIMGTGMKSDGKFAK